MWLEKSQGTPVVLRVPGPYNVNDKGDSPYEKRVYRYIDRGSEGSLELIL